MAPDSRQLETGARALTLLLAAALALSSVSAAPAVQEQADAPGKYRGVRVGAVNFIFNSFNEHEDMTAWTDMARKTVPVREGGPFSAGLLEDSKKSLALLKKFSVIQADTRLDRGLVAVDFNLTPFRFIKKITIRGNSAIMESEFAAVMTIHAGDPFREELLPEQEKLVREKFIAEGYINPAVTARAEQSGFDGNYSVYIDIRPGAYFTYGDIDIQGNSAVTGLYVWYRLFPETLRFIESEFRNNIAALKKHYWSRGYPEAEIGYTLNKDSGTGRVDITIDIREGPKYAIGFSGNKRFWNITLKKSLTLSERGNKNDSGARKSANNIISLYKTKGYPEARVKLDIRKTKKGGGDRKALTFVIEEGPRIEVSQLRITGNAFFSENAITKMMATAASGRVLKKYYNADILNNDVMIIRSLYERNGFPGASVAPRVRVSREKKQASIDIVISEGTRTVISSIEFKGNRVFSGADILKKIDLAPGSPYQAPAVTAAENRISALISGRGYPHVTVRGAAAFSEDRTGASIVFTIYEGRPVELGAVNFSGNLRTRTSYLRKQMSLKPGDPVSTARMLEEYKSISDIELFQTVNLTTFGLEEKRERANLYIDVAEKKPFLFSIGGGYNSGKGFYAKTGFEDRNFLGRYKSVWVRGEASQTGYSGAAGFTEPRLIGSRASATLSFAVDKVKEFNQTFGTLVYGPACSIKSVWFDSLTAGLGASYQERKMLGYLSLGDINEIEKTSQFHLRRILLFTAALTYDRRDSFIRPRKGFATSLSIDLSVDLTRPKTRIFAGDYSDNFIRYQYSLKCYVTPWRRLTFAAQAMLGYIQPYTPVKGIISDQLFYLGGIGNVRGFRENMLKYDTFNNPVGGRASLAASIEARIDLGFNFELTGFFDAGRIDNAFHDWYRMRMSAGTGLRYVTPVGPIGLLYGFKINKRKGEDLGVLNISIGYTF